MSGNCVEKTKPCLCGVNSKIFETLLQIEDPNLKIGLMDDFGNKRQNILSQLNMRIQLSEMKYQNDAVLLG